MSTACWADPLSRAERRVLREKLARAVHKLYRIHDDGLGMEMPELNLWTEFAELHLDVTERAAVPTS